MMELVVICIGGTIICGLVWLGMFIARMDGMGLGYQDAAEDSLKDNPPARWREALIDAEAEFQKELLK